MCARVTRARARPCCSATSWLLSTHLCGTRPDHQIHGRQQSQHRPFEPFVLWSGNGGWAERKAGDRWTPTEEERRAGGLPLKVVEQLLCDAFCRQSIRFLKKIIRTEIEARPIVWKHVTTRHVDDKGDVRTVTKIGETCL